MKINLSLATILLSTSMMMVGCGSDDTTSETPAVSGTKITPVDGYIHIIDLNEVNATDGIETLHPIGQSNDYKLEFEKVLNKNYSITIGKDAGCIDADGDHTCSSADIALEIDMKGRGDFKYVTPLTTLALENSDADFLEKVKDFDPVASAFSSDNETKNLVALSHTVVKLKKAKKSTSKIDVAKVREHLSSANISDYIDDSEVKSYAKGYENGLSLLRKIKQEYGITDRSVAISILESNTDKSTIVAMLKEIGTKTSKDINASEIANDFTAFSASVNLSPLEVNQTAMMSDVNFPLGTVKFSNGFELNATWGVGSAAAHKAGDANNTFYTLSDRGVNIKCADDEKIIGIDICEKGKIFPFPSFTPTIVKYEINDENVTITEVIPFKGKSGALLSGISNPLSNFSEIAYDIQGKEIAYDVNGFDTEALAVLSDGSFWISEEYASSIAHLDANGTVIERLVPAGLEDDLAGADYDVKGVLPAIISKRHANRGIESLAVSVDEQHLYFIMQSPLDNPDYATTSNVRLYKMSLDASYAIEEFMYVMDKPETFVKDNETKSRVLKDVKISEMTIIDNDVLMVLERISATTKLYKVDLTTATAVPSNLSDTLETDSTGITAVSKVKIFDTDLETGYPNKVEGIADLGDGNYLTVNDNDFGIEGDKTVMKIANIDVNGTIDPKQTLGKVVFFNTDGEFEKSVTAGVLPDMVKFTHDGKKVLVANEGEVVGNEDLDAPLFDPLGTISIIDMEDDYKVSTIDFKSIINAPEGSKIRKGAEIARDFEPEYIAINEANTVAWVTLQESNAVARIDLNTNTLDKVFGLGFKDLSLNHNAIDSAEDDAVNIATLPTGVYAMYQPDTISAYTVGGKDYFVTANEGDDRDDYYGESVKASKLTHTAIGDVGDLKVNPDLGDANGDGDYEELYAYGTRSFSIWDGETGTLVYDSANQMATTVASQIDNAYFNTRPKKGKWYGTDERSEKKGIEPEALTLAHIDGKTFAYIGLEKQGGFFVYDITDPANATMVEYNNDIDYTKTFDYDKTDATANVPADIDDMAPEGSVTFAQDSKNYYALSSEVSGTVSVYELANDGTATKQGTYRTGYYYVSATEIVDYDGAGKRLFVTSAAKNAIIVIDVADVTAPTLVQEIDLSAYGTNVNSVSVYGDKIAVAVEVKE